MGVATAGPAAADCLSLPTPACYDEKYTEDDREGYQLVDVRIPLPNGGYLQGHVSDYRHDDGYRQWAAQAPGGLVTVTQEEFGGDDPDGLAAATDVIVPGVWIAQRVENDGSCTLTVYGPLFLVQQDVDCTGAAVPYTPPPRLS